MPIIVADARGAFGQPGHGAQINGRDRTVLRRRRSTVDKYNELPALHSITSSARSARTSIAAGGQRIGQQRPHSCETAPGLGSTLPRRTASQSSPSGIFISMASALSIFFDCRTPSSQKRRSRTTPNKTAHRSELAALNPEGDRGTPLTPPSRGVMNDWTKSQKAIGGSTAERGRWRILDRRCARPHRFYAFPPTKVVAL